nr:winged helix-turn-helix transcriptional regulator [Flavobacterium piscis]
MLASRLQSLEDNKLIEKLEHPDSKAKVLYKLTQKAIDLLPIIVEKEGKFIKGDKPKK